MKSKGFTLIELLVVVAIIGILATVVLASLGTAQNKSKDAAAKAALSQMRAQAEIQYDGDYSDVCDATTVAGALFRDALANATYVEADRVGCIDSNQRYYTSSGVLTSGNAEAVDANGTLWGASIKLSDGNFFCVDSNGAAKISATRMIDPWQFATDKTC